MHRIGLVITSLVGGGAEKVVLNLAEMFRKKGIDVHIFLLRNDISFAVDLSFIHPLSEKRKRYKVFKKRGDQLLGKKLKETIFEIERDGIEFDMILSHLPAADRVVSSVELNRNIFYTMHTTYSFEIDEMRKRREYLRAYRRARNYRKLYKGKNLISVSEGIAKDLDSLGIDYASSRIIYNPFDSKRIMTLGNAECMDIPQEEYMIIAAAFRKEKRFDIALKAYSKLSNPPKLKLLCKKDKALLKMISELELEEKVEVLGFRKNPYPYMKNAKLLILSSEREGLPTVLIESLILGTPIVSTNCISGPSEILTGELSQYLAKVNDSDDLALKISMALENYPKIDQQSIKRFREETIYDEYTKIIG